MDLREAVSPCVPRLDLVGKLQAHGGRWKPGSFSGNGSGDL